MHQLKNNEIEAVTGTQEARETLMKLDFLNKSCSRREITENGLISRHILLEIQKRTKDIKLISCSLGLCRTAKLQRVNSASGEFLPII